MTSSSEMYSEIDDNKNLDKLTSIMGKISEHAKVLWKRAIDEGCENLPDPSNWIFNQDTMREMRDDWCAQKIKHTNSLLQFAYSDNSFSDYMKFMYEHYPPQFGNTIIRLYQHSKPGTIINWSRIYLDLCNKHNITINVQLE